jgi:hypothetical protein
MKDDWAPSTARGGTPVPNHVLRAIYGDACVPAHAPAPSCISPDGGASGGADAGGGSSGSKGGGAAGDTSFAHTAATPPDPSDLARPTTTAPVTLNPKP